MESVFVDSFTTTMELYTKLGGVPGILEVERCAVKRSSPSSASSTPEKPQELAPEDPETSRRLLAMLREAGVRFGTLEHAPAKTSQESATIRGVPLASGAKAMLIKVSRSKGKAKEAEEQGLPTHYLCVLSAARKLDIKAVRKLFGKIRFANEAELREVAGCVVGAVPPFGSLFRGGRVQTVVDPSLMEQGDTINFNCGLRTASVCNLAVKDFLRLEPGHTVQNISLPA